jgi:hypothetical protein
MAASSLSIGRESYPSTPTGTIPAMPTGGKHGGQEPAARAMRALERGATAFGAQVARSVQDRWRRLPAERRAKLEGLAANVRQQAQEPPPRGQQPPVRPPKVAAEPTTVDPDVSEIDVRDLRAELARELERLAGADISASRGTGKLAGEAPPAD